MFLKQFFKNVSQLYCEIMKLLRTYLKALSETERMTACYLLCYLKWNGYDEQILSARE